MNRPLRSILLAGLAAAALSAPAWSGVKEGITAWQRGDYAVAIAEWKPLADAGNADAQFNLAQAYKTGRGVPVSLPTATTLYRKAAEQGHRQAQDYLGLLLFQHGDQVGAMPWIEKGAAHGDPRAQYILGTAKFNGDLAAKDWVQAYALMSRAAASGLAPAGSSLAQMEGFLTTNQRAQGAALAAKMAAAAPPPAVGADLPASRPTRLATNDVYFGPAAPAAKAPAAKATTPAPVAKTVEPAPKPAPVKIAEAAPKPAEAPASAWAKPAAKPAAAIKTAEGPAPAPVKPIAPKPAPVVRTAEAPAPAPVKSFAPPPAPVKAAETPAKAPASAGGKWHVQFGAFANAAAARDEWERIKDRPGIAGLVSYTMAYKAFTRLRAGPLKDRAAAADVCAAAKAAGGDCFVVAP